MQLLHKRLKTLADIEAAWELFLSADSFRSGDFIAEQEIHGEELAVETVVDKQVKETFVTRYLKGNPEDFFEIGHYVSRDEPTWALDARRLSTAVHNSLCLRHVITHLEMIIPNEGPPAIVELNPRIGGDMIPELHRIVSGKNIYRMAGQIGVGKELTEVIPGRGKFQSAMIRFRPPAVGILQTVSTCGGYLTSPEDKIGFLHDQNSYLTGGKTNDDRSAYFLLAGNDLHEMNNRAEEALENGIIALDSNQTCELSPT